MNIVRRFLLAPSLARLIRKERGSARVAEGYFVSQSARNSHVVLDGDHCQLVLVTTEADGSPIEERTEVPRAHADALLDVSAGRVIYDRARLAIGGGFEALVDRFATPGVIDLVGVEFESGDDAASFRAPAWFGPEVTGDRSYSARNIALGGVPQVDDVPLSNEALDELLDAFEERFEEMRPAVPAAPRRSATDTSVIDALRRLASPEQSGQSTVETMQIYAETAAGEEHLARPLARRNHAPRRDEDDTGKPASSPEVAGDTRIDDVIATLTQALGPSTAPDVTTEAVPPAAPEAERAISRLRRLGL